MVRILKLMGSVQLMEFIKNLTTSEHYQCELHGGEGGEGGECELKVKGKTRGAVSLFQTPILAPSLRVSE